jgi:hypothetical protein
LKVFSAVVSPTVSVIESAIVSSPDAYPFDELHNNFVSTESLGCVIIWS